MESNLKPIIRFVVMAVLAFATIGGVVTLTKAGKPFEAMFTFVACAVAWYFVIKDWREHGE